jgi:hypothetical protein
MEITLTAAHVVEAKSLARATYEKYASMPGYYNNRPDSHLKGKLGELAVEAALREANTSFDSAFRDPERDRDSDIIVQSARLEVKTWSDLYWDSMGRCIAVGQLPTLKRKADFIVWCSTSYRDEEEALVKIYGVTPVDRVEFEPRRLTGPTHGRQVDNYQVEATSISDFEDFMRTLPPAVDQT